MEVKPVLSNTKRVSKFLKDKYTVEVVVKDFSKEEGVEIGILSHKKILVNKKSRSETEILFVIAHLFGHMVQLTNYSKYKNLVEETEKQKPLTLSEDFKKAFHTYEVEAYKIGKKLLEEVLGPTETEKLDERFQIYLDTDFGTFLDYLTTGHQISVEEFNNLLGKNYIEWSGRYPKKLRTIKLPEEVNPQKEVVVY